MLGLEDGYPWVALMSYTPHVLPVAALALAVSLFLRQWRPAVLAGAALIALLVVLAPRAVGGPDDVEGRHLRVMSSNVLRGGGDAERLVELIRERDVEVLTVQELTAKFQLRFKEAGGDALLPHSVLAVREGVIGSGIYSRYPTRSIGTGSSSPGAVDNTQTRGIVEVEPGLRLSVLSAHPSLPGSKGQTIDWERGLDEMPAPSERGPVGLLLGDFNATLDQDEFRNLVDRGYADAAERMGEGLTPTWPDPDRPLRFRFLPVTIDHVLYDKHRVGVRDYEVLDLAGSDHRTLYAELVITG